MQHADVLFGITMVLYCAASALYLWSLVGKTPLTGRLARASAGLGCLVHAAAIVVTGVELHRAPFTNLFESLVFVAWALMAIYLVMQRKYHIAALGASVSLVALCAVAFASALPRGVNADLAPALRSHWSSIHVTTSLVGYACFALAFGAAIGYILQEHMLKAKQISVLQKHLPSLDAMDQLAYRMVSLGFPMLTLGVITGALWAQSAWNSYWSWDPKETWALITWLVYAAYLHVRIVQGRRGKWANRLLIVGFGCVIVTYFGVNFLSYGLHRYNW